MKVIYRQETANLAVTEREDVNRSAQGTGLWKVGPYRTVSVKNQRTTAEVPVFDTDNKMRSNRRREGAA